MAWHILTTKTFVLSAANADFDFKKWALQLRHDYRAIAGVEVRKFTRSMRAGGATVHCGIVVVRKKKAWPAPPDALKKDLETLGRSLGRMLRT